MGNVHDSLFRDTFGQPEHAAPLLRALLPAPLAAAIDWQTLEPLPEPQVDERQRNQQVDLLFVANVAERPAVLYVVVEHKARPDRWTALQVLAYVVGVWRDLSRRRPRPRRLPPILPIVVSFGRRPWRTSADLASLLALDGVLDPMRSALRAAMPQFRLTPHDFATKTAAEVRAMGLSLLGLWTIAAQRFVAPVGRDDDAAIRAIAEWADVARQLIVADTGQQAFEAISSYLLKVTRLSRQRLSLVFDQHIGDAAMKKFVSTYDRITRESRAEGKAEGRVETILDVLNRRFGPLPPAIEERVRRGSTAELKRWTGRLVDAAALEEVFGGARPE